MFHRTSQASFATNRPPTELHGSLSTLKVAALSLAAAAPLIGIAGTVPLSMSIGNGAGAPGAYLIATATLLCFAVGYAAISRRVTSTGGFYTYVARSLGRPSAAASGTLALLAYNAMVVALAGGIGYFARLVGQLLLNADLPWWGFSVGFVALMGICGYRKIDISGRILTVLMALEFSVLTLLTVAIILIKGTAAFPAAAFSPHTVFSGAPSVAIMFAFGSFCGFEAVAVYALETRMPKRTLPRAMYIAVVTVGFFFCLSSWTLVGALGVDQVRNIAGKEQGMMVLGVAGDFLGPAMVALIAILIITSAFACLLASHNAASRYLYALGHERLMPQAVGRTHPVHQAPYVASLTQTGLCLLIVTVYAAAGLDPYRNLTTTMSGISTLGIMLLEATVCVAVMVYFRKDPDWHWWRTLLAPAIAFLGLLASTVVVWINFNTLTGSDSPIVNSLPWLVAALPLLAAARPLWLRSRDPNATADLGTQNDQAPGGPTPVSTL
ncbi:APC family permease [Streptomyces sp. NPDC002573]|uniref:APC family permease n=1 Tax=Streptomyces sp. NPDC002573 TaxID=3364651 RepID=UPI0036BC9DED